LHIATLSYTAIGGGSELTISQARGDMPAFRWDEVPPSAAVERVKLGEEGFSFKYAQYDASEERVTLVYEPGSGSGNAGIYIYLMPLSVSPETNYRGNLPPEAKEGRILHVIVNPSVQPNRIITVFFDRRLRKKK